MTRSADSPAATPTGGVELVATLLEHRRTKPDSSWAVANVELAEVVAGAELVGARRPGARFSAVGPRMGLAAPGETLRLRGAFEASQYGEQFRVDEQTAVGITSAAQAGRWLERLDGVGPKRAARLHDHFGDRIVGVLQYELVPGEPDPLCEVEGISPTVARTIRESWGELGASGSLEDLRYLDGLGLTRYQVNSILDYARKRGKSPQELLEGDPYSLTAARGFGFLRTDEVALRAGTSRLAPARLEAAALFACREACDGDTMARYGQVVRQAAEMVGVDEALMFAAVGRVCAAGRLVTTKDEPVAGRAAVTWLHPPDLLAAERTVFRLARDEATERAREEEARPLVLPAPGAVAAVARVADAAIARASALDLSTTNLNGPPERWS